MDVQPQHTPEQCYVDVDGLRIHYLDWGNQDTPPLLLLHGARSNAHAFDQFSDHACDDHHVMAFDHRGHGDSAWSGDEGYGMDLYVADFAGAVERLGVRDFALMGHSLGGMVAMTYAASHPGMVGRLVIVDVGPELGAQGVQFIRDQAAQTPDEFDSPEAVYQFMRSWDPLPPDDMLRYRATHMVKQLPSGKWAFKADPKLSFGSQRRRPTVEENWAMLASIECPTLVVHGAISALLPEEVAERMAQVLPHGEMVSVPRAGHRVMLDNPEGFANAVRGFLDR